MFENHEDAVHLSGYSWIAGAIAKYFGNEGVQKLNDAVTRARAAGVPWLTILTTLLPMILTLFSGGSLSLDAIIQAILALIHPVPSPKP